MSPYINSLSSTPWSAGPLRSATREHLFGAMYEDPAMELQVFPPSSRVFCIASAGCTARVLASVGHEVTAVDINPQQVLYAKARTAGAPARLGTIDRLLSFGRSMLPAVGWTEARRLTFLSMCNPCDQAQYWRSLDSKRWRLTLDAVLSRWVLRFAYARSFVGALPSHFGSVLRARLERTWRIHPNAPNPYAWRLLLGEQHPAQEARLPAIRFACADAADYLEACKAASFDAFTLSNISDGAPPSYVQRLRGAISRAATPGAIVVTRSIAEPVAAIHKNLAACDRSMIWGRVYAGAVGDLCSLF